MVGRPADAFVISSLKASDSVLIETCDPRSDNRRRIVEVAREGITIRRVVAGVSMAIRVAPPAYRGVALRITGLEDGRFHYEVRLAHRDPDLTVPLAEGEDLVAVEAQWRRWAAFFRLPALAGRAQANDTPVWVGVAELCCRTPHARRKGRGGNGRKSGRLRRRVFEPLAADVVDADPTVLFYGWKVEC
jgi:hypothetical protein